jgi:hypothetical protein
LPSKREALSSTPAKKKKKKPNEELICSRPRLLKALGFRRTSSVRWKVAARVMKHTVLFVRDPGF